MVGKSVEEVLKRNQASGSTGFRAGPHYWRRGPSVSTLKANFEVLSKAGWRDICEGSDTNIMKQTPRRPLTSELTLLKTSNFFVSKQMYVLQR